MSIQMDLFSGDAPGFEPVTPPISLTRTIDLEDVAPAAAPEQSSKAPGGKLTLLPPSSPPANFAGLMEWLRSGDPTETRNKQMRSALNTFAKVLGKPLRELPCDPGVLGKLLKEANPVLIGVTQARWFGTKSLVRSALAESGVEIMPGRASHPMSPAWENLASRIKDKSGRYGLQRLLRYFTREAIEPADVDEEAFAAFRVALETTSMLTDPATTYYNSVRLWNLAAATVEGWPQFLPADADRRGRYAVSWDTLPQAFRDDVEAYLAAAQDNDPTVDREYPPIKSGTAATRRQIILQVATGLLMSGFPPEDLTGLCVLVAPLNARMAIKQLREAFPDTSRTTRANQVDALLVIARRWVKAGSADVDNLKRFASQLRPKHRGMTPKNRERLRQFDVEGNLEALILLPQRVAARVRRSDRGRRESAYQMMMAVAVELLLRMPLRFGNYAKLEVEKNLRSNRSSRDRVVHLVIPAEDTKTNKPFEARLSKRSLALLDDYLANYRHRLTPKDGPYLFPGRNGGQRARDAFSRYLMDFIKEETGLVMNAHLFRHLAAYIYLRENPDGIETVRQILGHSDSKVTLRHYAEIKDEFGARQYDALLNSKLDAKSPPPKPRKPRSPKSEDDQ